MGRKTVSTDVKKNVILLYDIGMSQHKISRQLKNSRRCIRQIIRKFDKYGTVAQDEALDARRKLRIDKHGSSNLKKFATKQIP